MKSFIFVTSLWMVSLIANTGGSLATGPSSASRGKGVMDTEKNTVEWEPEERYYMRDAKALAAWDLGVTAELLARSGKGAKALHKIDTGGVSGLFQFFTKETGSLMLSSGKHDIVYTLHDQAAKMVSWENTLKRGQTHYFKFPSGKDNGHLHLYTKLKLK
ncbi:hypothetical protein PGT21_014371 [Puccinia graminis f. sp. tritici]|uniref:Uncharacterized protein n=1 Tax=Puccinia graminis f. sp. tritici TaxID=56615 RepID=A0A5B0MKY4_PUCGR|nr:hypothetical protein PGT21_014371 [Puccinia graminis f. sp. tritici]KAA1126813.1 hypothetical protein PGTUg99_023685 [Puccinia graminis f. sp. tritici]